MLKRRKTYNKSPLSVVMKMYVKRKGKKTLSMMTFTLFDFFESIWFMEKYVLYVDGGI